MVGARAKCHLSPVLRRCCRLLVHNGSCSGRSAATLPLVRIRAVVAALVMSTVLVACSNEPGPSPLPELPTASPTPSPLSVPPAALAETPQGAAAFSRYYFEQVLSRAFQKADASRLRSLSDSGCEGCNNFIAAIQSSAEAKEVTEGGDFSVLFTEAPPIDAGEVIVDLRYSRTAARVVAEDGAVRATLPADPTLDVQIRLVHRAGGWVVMGIRKSPT